MKNQYVTLTVISKDIDMPITEIVPNEGGKYSILKKCLLNQESYRIKELIQRYPIMKIHWFWPRLVFIQNPSIIFFPIKEII